jgi:hypothetical protein
MDERVLIKFRIENFNPTNSVKYDWSGFLIARFLKHMYVYIYVPYRKMFQQIIVA